jgi:hypothetical protein
LLTAISCASIEPRGRRKACVDGERRHHGTPRLTARQRELMRLIAAGPG